MTLLSIKIAGNLVEQNKLSRSSIYLTFLSESQGKILIEFFPCSLALSRRVPVPAIINLGD
jgi:hypothetical protein